MSLNTVVWAAIVTLLAATPTSADQSCCGRHEHSAADIACCLHDGEPDAVAVLLMMDQRDDHVATTAEFDRQTMTVWFHKPVKIGDRILLGKYIIEHDNERMSRGWPCTYIYAASDPRLPVVAFRCTHLTRPMTDRPTLIVRSMGEANGMSEMLAFQFGGETAAHGVPTGR
jgi:hypothetical protein